MKLQIVKPQTAAQMSTQTTMDTVEITPDLLKSWKVPPFQRPLRINDKVQLLADQIRRDGGVIPGVLVIGVINKERYIVDGQHRREAFLLSGSIVGYVDIRVLHFADMAEMGEEYVNLNSRLVNMRPDDVLRGVEESFAPLGKIRKRCSFVGYDQIRRGEKSPVLGMSAVLRCWTASSTEVPRPGGFGSALSLGRALSMEEAETCIEFLGCAYAAWGRDQSSWRLWANLNLMLCMWLYRRLVVAPYSPTTPRLKNDVFTKCLMSIAADSTYSDWLLGRNAARDASPAYKRIKEAFAKRIEVETGKKPRLPQPEWAS